MLKWNIPIKILLLIVCGSYSIVISLEILKPPFFWNKNLQQWSAFVNTKKKLSMLKFCGGLAILFDLIWIKRETEKEGRKEGRNKERREGGKEAGKRGRVSGGKMGWWGRSGGKRRNYLNSNWASSQRAWEERLKDLPPAKVGRLWALCKKKIFWQPYKFSKNDLTQCDWYRGNLTIQTNLNFSSNKRLESFRSFFFLFISYCRCQDIIFLRPESYTVFNKKPQVLKSGLLEMVRVCNILTCNSLNSVIFLIRAN